MAPHCSPFKGCSLGNPGARWYIWKWSPFPVKMALAGIEAISSTFSSAFSLSTESLTLNSMPTMNSKSIDQIQDTINLKLRLQFGRSDISIRVTSCFSKTAGWASLVTPPLCVHYSPHLFLLCPWRDRSHTATPGTVCFLRVNCTLLIPLLWLSPFLLALCNYLGFRCLGIHSSSFPNPLTSISTLYGWRLCS